MTAVVEENATTLESTVTQVNETEEGSDVDSFVYGEFSQYVPEALKKELAEAFETKRYGWKSRARMLMKIDELTNHIATLTENLSFERGPRGPRKVDPRDGLRAYLMSRTEEQLQKVCEIYSVSYTSFNSDKANLIEALCDEALRD